MKVHALHKYSRVSPQKCRLVMDQIRGLKIGEALDILKFSQKKAAFLINKVLHSAVANAESNHGADIDSLIISEATVDAGPIYKRYRARARGRPATIQKRTSHIKIVLNDQKD